MPTAQSVIVAARQRRIATALFFLMLLAGTSGLYLGAAADLFDPDDSRAQVGNWLLWAAIVLFFAMLYFHCRATGLSRRLALVPLAVLAGVLAISGPAYKVIDSLF